MAHDRHFVQRRLAIEKDVVAIFQVSFDFVANLNVSVGSVFES